MFHTKTPLAQCVDVVKVECALPTSSSAGFGVCAAGLDQPRTDIGWDLKFAPRGRTRQQLSTAFQGFLCAPQGYHKVTGVRFMAALCSGSLKSLAVE